MGFAADRNGDISSSHIVYVLIPPISGQSRPIGPPLRHEQAVWSAAFDRDGTRVVTGSDDGTARLWDVRWPQGPITAVACRLLHDKEVTNLADRYGVRIQDAICDPGMPAPDLARLDPG